MARHRFLAANRRTVKPKGVEALHDSMVADR
jgi:hypothetical protein